MPAKIIQSISSILFPVFCAGCGAEGEWLCEKCLLKARLEPVCRCPGCAKKNDGSLCLGCRGFFPLDGVEAVFEYSENTAVSRLIRDFKYGYARDIIRVWEKICLNFFDSFFPQFLGTDSSWSVVPVPLYPRRERERGYNQAALLARIFCANINDKQPGKAVLRDDLIARVRPTLQQAKLSKEQRAENVKGAFAAWAAEMPENIILVDDVFTSGVTLFECARILKENGAGRVWAITLARSLFV